eukprot:1141700-Pelagomonas_calceolata.AAC.1
MEDVISIPSQACALPSSSTDGLPNFREEAEASWKTFLFSAAHLEVWLRRLDGKHETKTKGMQSFVLTRGDQQPGYKGNNLSLEGKKGLSRDV